MKDYQDRKAIHTANLAQLEAATPQKSIWVNASAGSGKTKVLVDRLLRLLLSGVNPTRILAITFTNAAAAEMQNRLSQKLAHWATCDNNTLNEELNSLLRHVASSTEMNKARKLFAEVLDNYDRMNIQTIHSFCQSLLGRFPVEAGVSARFTVIGEHDSSALFDRILSELVVNIEDNPEFSAAIAQLATLIEENGFKKAMQAANMERGRITEQLNRFCGVEGSISALRTQIGIKENLDKQTLEHSVLSDATIVKFNLKELIRLMAQQGGKLEKERAAQLAEMLAMCEEERTQNLDLWSSYFLKKSDGLPYKVTKKLSEQIGDILEHYTNYLLQQLETIKGLTLLALNHAFLTVASEVLTLYEQHKTALGLMDYDDLIQKARKLLEGSENAPLWVHYKLDEGLDHILVDEAQDVNPEQWEIITLLANLFFDDSQKMLERPRSLFVVGDEKQSIYSFQRADPAIFIQKRLHFKKRAKAAILPFAEIPMNVSFRSAQVILDAVDATFEQNFKGMLGREQNTWPKHKAAQSGIPGCVELWPLIPPPDKKKSQELEWILPLEPTEIEKPSRTLAKIIAHEINNRLYSDDEASWLAEKQGGRLKKRRLKAGDIMILLRKRGHFARELVHELKKANIPVAGQDRVLLSQELVVKDLVSLLRFLSFPDDDLNLAALLKSPLCGLDDEELFTLCHKRSTKKLWQVLRKNTAPEFQKPVTFLQDCLEIADTVPVYEILAFALGPRGGRKAFLARLGQDANEMIDELMDIAIEYDSKYPSSIQGFLSWFLRIEAPIKRDLETIGNQVRIITAHSSKGLQAPFVIIADIEDRGNKRDGFYFHENLMRWCPSKEDEEKSSRALSENKKRLDDAENRRLLYVAMTRAEQHLILCGTGKEAHDKDQKRWYDLVTNALNDKTRRHKNANLDAYGPIKVWKQEIALETITPKPKTPKQERYALPTWYEKQAPNEPSPPRPLVPSSAPEEEDIPRWSAAPKAVRARKVGIIVHELLEQLPLVETSRRKEALASFIKQQSDLTITEGEKITQDVFSVLTDSRLKALFGPQSRAEVGISGQVGEKLVTGKIDRLLIEEERIIVADFKTGHPLEETPKSYQHQLKLYKDLLGQLYPQRSVEAWLIWTQGPLIQEID